MKHLSALTVVLFLTTGGMILGSLLLPVSLLAQFHPIELLSSPNSGNEADGTSGSPNISFSTAGRYAVFESAAENLVTGDTNGVSDIFLVDRSAADGSKISRISIDRNSTNSDGASRNPSISADGQFIVFESDATDLVTNDNNGNTDIFLRDTTNDMTTRVSVDTNGFDSDGDSVHPQISSDGKFIVFTSAATDLVLNDINGKTDIFLYDRVNTSLTRVSVDSDELESDGASDNPSINGNGSLIVFDSAATNLVSDDTNASRDIFLRKVSAGTTQIISHDTNGGTSDGMSSNAFISDDGTLITFQSAATDLILNDNNENTDIFLYTVASDTSVRASGNGDGTSSHPTISADNAFVVFQSTSTDIVKNDTNNMSDIFAYTVSSEAITRLSVTETGRELVDASTLPMVNANGQYVIYRSDDEDVVTGDTNTFADVFLVDTQCLLTPMGVTPQDQDSDGTDDCSDACPSDSSKIAAGSCGCGTAETDSDSDGTPDCIDSCSSDSSKTAAGDCGCGLADTDSNSNGISDCLEFTAGSRPRKPIAVYRKKSPALRVVIPLDPPGFRYLIQVRQNGKTLRKKRTSQSKAKISAQGIHGRVDVRYKVIGVTKFSRSRGVTIR